jgi:acetyl esterase
MDQAMPSVDELGGGEFYVHASDYAYCWDKWVPEELRAHPYATPYTNADLSGVAPALVATAAYDPLRDEGEEYGSRLWRAGVEATITRYPGVVHGFALRWDQMARANDCHRQIVDFLHRSLGA